MSEAITDLSISKTADDYTPKMDQHVTWTITVSNVGESAAQNVRVEDMIPEGTEFVSGSANGESFDLSEGLWNIGDLALNGTATATVVTKVTNVDDYINNYATVHTDTHDCNPLNDTNTMAVDPWEPTHADLSLVKTVSDAAPVVGQVIEWTVTVTNGGQDTAWNTTVNEMLPDGLEFVGARASEGGYDFESGLWNVGHLANGESAHMVISTRVASEAAVEYVNTASASSSTADSDHSNNTAHATATVVAAEPVVDTGIVADDPTVDDTVADDTDNGGGTGGHGQDHGSNVSCVACLCACDVQEESGADLQVVKLVSNPTPDVNSPVTWTVVVTNNGPEDAVNVSVLDNLPAGVEYESDAATMGEFDAAAGKWEIGDLANGESAMLQITSIVTDAAVVQTNVAVVMSDTEDSNPENNVAMVSVDAVDADLMIVKTVDIEEPNLDSEVTWTIDVTNNGPDTAEGVFITDVLPQNTTFTETSDERYDPVTGRFSMDELESGDSVSFTVTATVDDLAPQINVASVFSATYDSDPTNNTDDAEVDAVAVDLELVKSVSKDTAAPEDIVEWTLEVTNQGPDVASGVQVQDVLPEGVSYVSDTSGGALDSDTGIWTIGDLGVNKTATLTIATEVVDTGVLKNIAQVIASDQVDLDSAVANDDGDQSEDDEDSAVLTVIDLALTQELLLGGNMSTTTAGVGDTVTYVITVTNESTVDATGVTVSSDLTAHFENETLTFVTSNDAASNTVFDPVDGWTIGDLPAGESITLSVNAVVNTPGAIENVAQVSAADQFDIDSTPGNYDGEPLEDDEASVSLTIEAGLLANPNDLGVEGSGGASINAVVVIDRSSSMKQPITIDGVTETRLVWNIEAVKDFASRPEIQSVKIIAFDGRVTDGDVVYDGGNSNQIDKNYIPATEVSEWIDVTEIGNTEVGAFLETLAPSDVAVNWGSGTNYQAAIDATMAQTDAAPTVANETNYYFFSDGVPTSGGASGTNKLLNENEWQAFAEANFDNTYAVGFAGAIGARDALEQVAHINENPDDPAIDDDPNLLLVSDVDAIPSVLNNFASTSVSGNAIADDVSQGGISITKMVFDSVTYTYSGGSISESGPGLTQGATLTNSFVVVDSIQGGSLQFDFETGDFTYFAPTTDIELTEFFDYTIVGDGDTASSTVTIKVMESPDNSANEWTDVSLISDDDYLFESAVMGVIQLPESSDSEWAGNGEYHQDDMYDMLSLIV